MSQEYGFSSGIQIFLPLVLLSLFVNVCLHGFSPEPLMSFLRKKFLKNHKLDVPWTKISEKWHFFMGVWGTGVLGSKFRKVPSTFYSPWTYQALGVHFPKNRKVLIGSTLKTWKVHPPSPFEILTNRDNSDCSVQKEHQEIIIGFLIEVEFLLLLNVEVVHIRRRENREGSGNCHSREFPLLYPIFKDELLVGAG